MPVVATDVPSWLLVNGFPSRSSRCPLARLDPAFLVGIHSLRGAHHARSDALSRCSVLGSYHGVGVLAVAPPTSATTYQLLRTSVTDKHPHIMGARPPRQTSIAVGILLLIFGGPARQLLLFYLLKAHAGRPKISKSLAPISKLQSRRDLNATCNPLRVRLDDLY